MYINGELLTEAKIHSDIKPYAFIDCISIEKIFIDRGVTSIGKETFYGCKNLSYVEYDGTKREFRRIKLDDGWRDKSGIHCVVCKNGVISFEKHYGFLDDLRYKLNSDGKTYRVSDAFPTPLLSVFIAGYYMGLPVTNIPDCAFEFVIGNIHIPRTITSIGTKALGKNEYFIFAGTKEEWQRIQKSEPIVNTEKTSYLVHCLDGDIRENIQ